PVVANAQVHVIDASRVDASALDGGVDDVRGHHRCFGVVERAPVGLADARAGGGNDCSFTHGKYPTLESVHIGGAEVGPHFDDLAVIVKLERVDHIHALVLSFPVQMHRK